MANITKSILVREIAKETKVPMTTTRTVIEGFISGVTKHLSAGDKINIDGFGTFKVQEVPERPGPRKDPVTGEKIMIPEHVRATFKYSKNVTDAVNGR